MRGGEETRARRLFRASWAVGKALAFILSEIGVMKGSKQSRDLIHSGVHRLPLAAVGGSDWGVRARAGRPGKRSLVHLDGCVTLGALAMMGTLEEGKWLHCGYNWKTMPFTFAAGFMWRG